MTGIELVSERLWSGKFGGVDYKDDDGDVDGFGDDE